MNNEEQLIRNRQLCELLCMSRSSIYRKMKLDDPAYDSSFPKPVKIGNSSRWILREVQNWIKLNINKRDSR